MKITEIRGFNLSFPLKEPLGNSLTFFRKRDALLVQIVTDAGISGWGEAGNSPHAAGTFIRTRLARLVLGQSPADYGRHYQAMTAALGYDRRGAGMMAISAIDHGAARSRRAHVRRQRRIAAGRRGARQAVRLCERSVLQSGRRPLSRFRTRGGKLPEAELSRDQAARRLLAARRWRDGEGVAADRRTGRRADGRYQPGLHRARGHRLRAAHGGSRPALDRGAGAAGGHRRLSDGRASGATSRSPAAKRSATCARSANSSPPGPSRCCSPTSPSAAATAAFARSQHWRAPGICR